MRSGQDVGEGEGGEFAKHAQSDVWAETWPDPDTSDTDTTTTTTGTACDGPSTSSAEGLPLLLSLSRSPRCFVFSDLSGSSSGLPSSFLTLLRFTSMYSFLVTYFIVVRV